MMTQAESQQVFQGLVSLAATFDKSMSSPQQKNYLKYLSDLPAREVLAALETAQVTCRYFPSIAELRALAGAGAADDKQALEDRAVLAWEAVRRLKGRLPYHPEALEDPLIRKAFRALGGRNGFGQWDYEKQEEWKRKEFLAVYQAAARDQRAGAVPALTTDESERLLTKLGGTA